MINPQAATQDFNFSTAHKYARPPFPILQKSRKAVFTRNLDFEATVARSFVFIWQIVFKHGLIRLKTFVSQFPTKLCN